MPKPYFWKFLLFAFAVSVFGMLTILVLALNSSGYDYDAVIQKPVVGLAFAFICISGLFVSLNPKTCSGIMSHSRISRQTEDTDLTVKNLSVRGHHVDCERFSAHTLRIGNSCLCAACSGLALGALVALAGAVGYFFFGVSFVPNSLYQLILGQAAVALGFTQYKLKGYGRLLLNTVFVLGAFLVLTEIDSLVGNVFVDLYVVGVIVMWILTRILLSQWDHWQICHSCPEPCRFMERAR